MLRWLLMSTTFWFASALADGHYLPMPPAFSHDGDPAQTLAAYPLGVITQQAAFSHHGPADRKARLPNGLEGWSYGVDRGRRLTVHVAPSGEKVQGLEPVSDERSHTYTLVFGHEGKVIDVLYARGGAEQLSALQFQRGDAGTGPGRR